MTRLWVSVVHSAILHVAEAERILLDEIGYRPLIKAYQQRPWSQFETELYERLSQVLEAEAEKIANQADPSGAFLNDPLLWEEHKRAIVQAIAGTVEALAAFAVAAGRDVLADAAPSSVNWSLVNRKAAEWATTYGYDMVSQITDTTKSKLGDALKAWIESGKPLSALRSSIRQITDEAGNAIFGPVRAEMIAVTEATRVYAEANAKVWEASGVLPAAFKPPAHVRCRCALQPKKLTNGAWVMVWNTARDEHVCVGPLQAPWGEVKGCRGLRQLVVSAGPYLGMSLTAAADAAEADANA